MSENTTISNPTVDGDRFPSLTALRNAHSEMLKLHRKWGNVPEMKAKIEQLINKGRVTGALLDSEEDRWAAQSLLDYWNSLLYRAGQEPPDTTLVDFDPVLVVDLGIDIDPQIISPSPTNLNSPHPIPPQAPISLPEVPDYSAPSPQAPIPFQIDRTPVNPTKVRRELDKDSLIHKIFTIKAIKAIKKTTVLFIVGLPVLAIALFKTSTTELLPSVIKPIISSKEINIRYNPNGSSILIVDKGTARLWSIQGELLSTIGKEGSIIQAIFSPDSKLIAITNLDENIELWDYQGRRKTTLNRNKSHITGMVFSPNGKFIATADSDKNISLWNIQGTLLSMRKDREKIAGLVFSPDSKFILTANTNGIVYKRDLFSQDPDFAIRIISPFRRSSAVSR
jgi:hypothetical protein